MPHPTSIILLIDDGTQEELIASNTIVMFLDFLIRFTWRNCEPKRIAVEVLLRIESIQLYRICHENHMRCDPVWVVIQTQDIIPVLLSESAVQMTIISHVECSHVVS